MDVYVFVYDHRFGRDMSVHASEELAVAAGARVARECWSDARDRDIPLSKRPPDRDATALETYFEAMDGIEFFEIAVCPVEIA